MRDNLRFSFTLFAICAIAALLLSLVYALTEPKINQQKEEAQQRAIREVLTGAEEIETRYKDGITYYEAKDKAGKLLGYIFITETQGYASTIRIAASINPQGRIIAIKILEQNETPGIGSRITEEAFTDKFKHKEVEQLDNIDAISAATISSSAVIKAVKDTAQKVLTHAR